MNSLPPNHLGKFLVEECERVAVKEFLDVAKLKLKRVLIKSEIKASGYNIQLDETKLHFGGIRLWFKCPICDGRRGVLFKHPATKSLGCRRCLSLEYKKRRYKNMIESKEIE